MAINLEALGLTTDLALADSVQQSQRWILSAMQEHGPGMVTMLWRILGNEQDVCDCYQETFVRLINLSQEEKPRNVRAYAYRTAANIAVSMLRRRQIAKKSQPQIAQLAIEHDAAGELDSKLLLERLREAISRLPDYLGDVIALRDLGQQPYQLVAQILSITPAAARVYRHKAIQLLAVWMAKEHSEGDL